MGVDSAGAAPGPPGADPAGPDATARIPAQRRPPGRPLPRVPAPRGPDEPGRAAPVPDGPGPAGGLDEPVTDGPGVEATAPVPAADRTVILPMVRPAPDRTAPRPRPLLPRAGTRTATPSHRHRRARDDTGLSRRPRRAELAGPAVPGRRAALTVVAGGLVALVGFLVVPHLTVPGAGPLTVPDLVDRTGGYEPAVRLLWSIGAGAVVVAVLGAVAAAVRRRWVRAVLAVGALLVSGALSVGYLVVGVAALAPGGPALAAGFAVVAGGLLLAFVGSIAALMTGGA